MSHMERTMADNRMLTAAGKAKKDEFYTQINDISNELKHYKDHFKGKVVFCNCDDPYESEFFQFFAMKFNSWGLKKLIATCWGGSQISQTEFAFSGKANSLLSLTVRCAVSKI